MLRRSKSDNSLESSRQKEAPVDERRDSFSNSPRGAKKKKALLFLQLPPIQQKGINVYVKHLKEVAFSFSFSFLFFFAYHLL
jgi:hypothetical protein